MAHMSVKTSPDLTHRITNRMQRDKKPTLSEYERHRYKSKTYGNVVIYTSGKLVCMGSDEQVDRFRDHFYDPSVEERS
jgi:ribonuclease HIII